MKKITIVFALCLLVFGSGSHLPKEKSKDMQIEVIEDESTYTTQQVEVCGTNSFKSYMDYRKITNTASKQYALIQDELTVDQTTGLLKDQDGFIAVALGSHFGEIGTRYMITLDSGVVLPVIKTDEKADHHTINGCAHQSDGSVIEFVVDTDIAKAYYADQTNNVIQLGNFDADHAYQGEVQAIELVIAK